MPITEPIPHSRAQAANPASCISFGLALVLLAALGSSARAQGAQSAQSTPPAPETRPATQSASLRIGPDGGYMKNDGGSRVIVFVHGFSGDASTAWRCDEAHDWPAMIAADQSAAFAGTDVYLLGYAPPPRRGKTSLADLEASIVDRMENAGVFSRHKQVVFVAQSMGGLLIQQILLTNSDKDWAKKVRAVFLYGTPQGSNKLAGLSRYIDSDPRFKDLESTGNNFILHAGDPQWSGIPHFCAYETQSDDTFTTLDYSSSTRGCTDLLAVHANHADIARPCDTGSASYTFLEDKLRFLQAQDDAAPATPSR